MPLTNDRAAVVNAIANVKTGMLNDRNCHRRRSVERDQQTCFRQCEVKEHNPAHRQDKQCRRLAPATAARIAAQKGIRIYTIGVGTNGSITISDPYGFSSTTMETKIDEQALKNIASITKGKYFRATDSRTLRNVFEEIDTL